MGSSWAEIESQLTKRLQGAMNIVNLHAENIMRQELASFYAGGTPRRYVRTGQLGNSAKVTPLATSGTTISFKAYLDKGSVYYHVPNPLFDFDGTGRYSHYTTDEVFDAAEAGHSGIVGRPGFWSRSERRIEQDLYSVIGSFFN